jgi:hypothetical protein
MVELYTHAQVTSDPAQLVKIEHDLRVLCRQGRALADSQDTISHTVKRLRQSRKTQRPSDYVTLWMLGDARVVCELIHVSPYCHHLVIYDCGGDQLLWCRAYVLAEDALPEAEYLRGVFGGDAVQ